MKRSQRTPLMALAAILLLAGCEEMLEGTAEGSTAAALIEAPVRRALGVPDGVQVVVIGTHSEGTRYVLRNPEVARATTGARSITRRLTVATVDTEGVADQFDTPERVASVRDGAVQFTEVSTFLEVFEAREAAQRLVGQAEDLLRYFGQALQAGGLDIDAVEAWTARQKGIVDQMEKWIADAHAQYETGPRLPSIEVTDALFHDPVLFVLELRPGETFSYTAPAVTGAFGTVTYFAGEGYTIETDLGPTDMLSAAHQLPSWMTFNASTRMLSGTVPPSTLPGEWNQHVYGAYDELGRVDWEPWLWKVVDPQVGTP